MNFKHPTNSQRRASHRRGYTLVELLVVSAIIVGLAAVVFVVVTRTRVAAKNAATLNSLRQIGSAAASWMGDNNNFFPPCWDNTEGRNRSYAQTLDPYIHNEENFRDEESVFIGPNARVPVKVNEFSHPITFSMNRAVCRDITSVGKNTEKLVHATQVERPGEVILMADGCQNPSNLGQANASAYRIDASVGRTGNPSQFNQPISIGPDEDTPGGDGWFRYYGDKCNALMCDGSARQFTKGSIQKRNIWIDRDR
ncbi:MAG: type II secretion system protein [Luteolibacter sp.]